MSQAVMRRAGFTSRHAAREAGAPSIHADEERHYLLAFAAVLADGFSSGPARAWAAAIAAMARRRVMIPLRRKWLIHELRASTSRRSSYHRHRELGSPPGEPRVASLAVRSFFAFL